MTTIDPPHIHIDYGSIVVAVEYVSKDDEEERKYGERMKNVCFIQSCAMFI